MCSLRQGRRLHPPRPCRSQQSAVARPDRPSNALPRDLQPQRQASIREEDRQHHRRQVPDPGLARRLTGLSQADTKALIETAVKRFLDDVPALQKLKLVAGLDLRARHDTQMYRVELPGPKVTKDIAADAKVRV